MLSWPAMARTVTVYTSQKLLGSSFVMGTVLTGRFTLPRQTPFAKAPGLVRETTSSPALVIFSSNARSPWVDSSPKLLSSQLMGTEEVSSVM